MKSSPFRVTGFLLAAVLMMGSAAYAQDEDDAPIKGSIAAVKGTKKENLVKMAKVSFQTALSVSLKRAPGKVLDGELQVEGGFLIYYFEIIRADNKTIGVAVDAGTGAVLRVDDGEDDGMDGNDAGEK